MTRAGHRRAAACVVVLASVLAGCGGGGSAAAKPKCPSAEVVFARGTDEAPGLGKTGRALMAALGDEVASHAVAYGAVFDQSSAGPGATDLTRYVRRRARECRSTRFVLGGYSQGASVVDIAIGMTPDLGTGEVLPRRLARRVAAVVVFGNPARRFGQRVDEDGGPYARKAFDDCNDGDPVCNAGSSFAAHLAYYRDGSADAAARFVQYRLRR